MTTETTRKISPRASVDRFMPRGQKKSSLAIEAPGASDWLTTNRRDTSERWTPAKALRYAIVADELNENH